VRNITDVDDKINARAARDYPNLDLNEAIAKVTKKTADQYHKDIKALGCLVPTYEPRATDHIKGMVKMTEVLIEKKHAYEAGGEVLFDVKSMPSYGALSNRKLDEQQAGARIDVKGHKKSPGDFVLWKLSNENEPGWDSPWGRGRPGWHLECSVMSEFYLGKVFDIHGGGLDLIFPHHENEIAQSCCAHENDIMANVWMHNGFLQVEGQKMSKSLGNFITISELLESDKFGSQKWAGDVLRLAMLMTNYKEPIDFSIKRLEEAKKILSHWKDVILELGMSFNDEEREEIEALGPCSKLLYALADDLNMAGVITHLHRHASGKKIHNARRLFGSLQLLGLVSFEAMQNYIKEIENKKNELDIPNIEQSITERLEALANKDWAKADEIRNKLAEQGILLKDAKDEKTGERITAWEIK
jgi:cysteinyl-tRNA synthetase